MRETYVSEYSFFPNPTPMPASGVWPGPRALLWLTRSGAAESTAGHSGRRTATACPPSLPADPKRDRLDAVKCSFLSVPLSAPSHVHSNPIGVVGAGQHNSRREEEKAAVPRRDDWGRARARALAVSLLVS